jgi:hypothetical protein
MIEIIKNFDAPIERSAIQRNLRKIGYNVSGHMCTRHLNELSDIGYLEKEKKGGAFIYTVGDLFNEFEFIVNWKNIIEETKKGIKEEFPEIADKYIEKYCTDPIIVIHPFSGKEVNLSELEEQKINLKEARNDLSSFIKEDIEKQTEKKIKHEEAKEKAKEAIKPKTQAEVAHKNVIHEEAIVTEEVI